MNVSYIDEAVEEAVRKKESGVMITIISKSGSSPRGTGSKMFIDKDGRLHRKHRRRKCRISGFEICTRSAAWRNQKI